MQSKSEYEQYRDSLNDLIDIAKLNLLIATGLFTAVAVILRSDAGITAKKIFSDQIILSSLLLWVISMLLIGVTFVRTRPLFSTSESKPGDEFLEKGGAITSAKQLHNYVSNIVLVTILSLILMFFGLIKVSAEVALDLTSAMPLIYVFTSLLIPVVVFYWYFGRLASPLLIITSLFSIISRFVKNKTVASPEDVHKYYKNLNPRDGVILREIHESQEDVADRSQITHLSDYRIRRQARIIEKLRSNGYIYIDNNENYQLTYLGTQAAKGGSWKNILKYKIIVFRNKSPGES